MKNLGRGILPGGPDLLLDLFFKNGVEELVGFGEYMGVDFCKFLEQAAGQGRQLGAASGSASGVPDQEGPAQTLFRGLDLSPDGPVSHFQFPGRGIDGTAFIYGGENPEPAQAEDNLTVRILDPDL